MVAHPAMISCIPLLQPARTLLHRGIHLSTRPTRQPSLRLPVVSWVLGSRWRSVVWSWVGFEAGAVYGEEARNPRRAVPVAVFAVVAFLTFLYTLTAYSATIGY